VSRRRLVLLAALSGAALLSACELAPPDKPTPVIAPVAFKEAEGWSLAAPADDAPRGAWWRIYGSAELDGLEARLDAGNQSLKAAAARYDQARALSREAASGLYPTLDAGARTTNTQVSRAVANPLSHGRFQDNLASLDLNYEIDVWGRVRDLARAGKDRAEASAADLAAIALSLRADLASDYFLLRGYDARIAVLDETVGSYGKALELTRSRFEAGYAAEPDVSAAEASLELARTQAAEARLNRARLEHAIAILTGAPPAGFALPPLVLTVAPPPVAEVLPGALLQRRPDIAAAQRRVFAANADIGVARAAFFPQFSLSGALGSESASAGRLLTAPAAAWAVGPSGALNLLDGGKRRALNAQARAAQAEAAANYRQTVLDAYGQVEDSLSALSLLGREDQTQQAAVKAASTARSQAERRYAAGYAAYYDVVTAQNIELSARLQGAEIQARRLAASVALIRSLGGGWTEG
jgi:NodT family efflux transporter outer membrane factor (OMF) lipoprotein